MAVIKLSAASETNVSGLELLRSTRVSLTSGGDKNCEDCWIGETSKCCVLWNGGLGVGSREDGKSTAS